jgi:hypothetical protein
VSARHAPSAVAGRRDRSAPDGLGAVAERRHEEQRERREADQTGLGRDLQEVVVRVRAPVGQRMAVVVRPRDALIAPEAETQDRMVVDDVEVRRVDGDPARIRIRARERRNRLRPEARRQHQRERDDGGDGGEPPARAAPGREQPEEHHHGGDPGAARGREHEGDGDERDDGEADPAHGRDEREGERYEQDVGVGQVVPEEAHGGEAVRALDPRAGRALSSEHLAIPIRPRVVLEHPVDGDHGARDGDAAREPHRRGGVGEPPEDAEVRHDDPEMGPAVGLERPAAREGREREHAERQGRERVDGVGTTIYRATRHSASDEQARP